VRQQERVSVVDGDYRIDNMVFRVCGPQVQAVLDWELSTLDDPMAGFHLPSDTLDDAEPRGRRFRCCEHSNHA
jgi:aminoglycoside phosphotransferase (APT) family kinase protein